MFRSRTPAAPGATTAAAASGGVHMTSVALQVITLLLLTVFIGSIIRGVLLQLIASINNMTVGFKMIFFCNLFILWLLLLPFLLYL